MKATGTLLLVATPIGNLGDISPRAVAALRQAEVIYCEDTRRSRQLLSHLEVSGKRLVSFHEHNEAARITEVLAELAGGAEVALVSDAGMPVISDPGQRLVAAVAAAGYSVSALPGANAALVALAISGLPAERFCFEGFLPTSGSARTKRLEALASEPRTAIIYESPHRVTRTVAELAKRCATNRVIVITRELTKLHEEAWRGSLDEAAAYLATKPPRGEYTLVLAGAEPVATEVSEADIIAALAEELAAGGSRRAAIDRVSERLGVPRKRVYALSLAQPR